MPQLVFDAHLAALDREERAACAYRQLTEPSHSPQRRRRS
jgi:hypothetical protein